jgi:hypothetical protein
VGSAIGIRCRVWAKLQSTKWGPVHSEETSSQPGWLARLVLGLDARLRRRLGVIAYSLDPGCIFRIELRRLDHAITLSDGTELLPGEEIVQLHFWNESVP